MARPRVTYTDKRCLHCGAKFKTRRPWQRFHTNDCRVLFNSEKRKRGLLALKMMEGRPE